MKHIKISIHPLSGGAIQSDDFLLVAVPLRLEKLDGSPARVFAMIE